MLPRTRPPYHIVTASRYVNLDTHAAAMEPAGGGGGAEGPTGGWGGSTGAFSQVGFPGESGESAGSTLTSTETWLKHRDHCFLVPLIPLGVPVAANQERRARAERARPDLASSSEKNIWTRGGGWGGVLGWRRTCSFAKG